MDANRRARELAERLPLGALSRRLGGTVVTPDDDAYADARRVWNGIVNEYPAAIAYCQSPADTTAAVEFARAHDIPTTVRSGGHSVSGASVVSGGLVIDCSRMEWVRVNPDERVARVGAGATWGTLDRAAQSFGLATPGGVVSDTGVAGLTLGGGTGYLSPKHGFTADNLREIDVVTGRGERVTANAERNADLFWAARGGGTPGVVTAFEFDLHPLDHEVRYFESWLPLDTAADALRAYRRYQRTAPDEACVSPYFAAVPETDDFPVERHGEVAVVLSGVYTGKPSEADATVDAFTARPASFAESVETMPYTVLQSMMDDDFPDGRRYYWKSVPLASFDDDAIRALESAAARMPSALSTIVVWPMHGAVARGSGADGPIAGRDADVVINVEAAWDGPMATTEHVEWVRETCRRFRALDATSGTLPNFAGGSDPDAEAVYADEADRLRAVRRTYDPDEVFAYERA